MSVIRKVLDGVARLPHDWHGAGSLGPDVLEAIADHASRRRIRRTAETGTGKGTLVFSHLSPHHTVFAVDDTASGDSLPQVKGSDLLRTDSVEFVVGPTQQTLPAHSFGEPLQVVLLDGPHAYPFPELEYYYFYPHLDRDALLIVDDIHIPTIFRLFEFLNEEEMFDRLGVIRTTAFFRRNDAPTFSPVQDGWWLQAYNKRRFPVQYPPRMRSWSRRVVDRLPDPAQRAARATRAIWRSMLSRRTG